MNIRYRVQIVALLAGAATLSTQTAQAQPPALVVPDTPEQRKMASRARTVESMRTFMKIYDLTDVKLQDTIIDFLKEQGGKRYALKQQRDNLIFNGGFVLLSDAQVLALLNEYRAAAQQIKVDYKESLLELDAKIGYTKNPRLEIVLVTLGIVGDEESISDAPGRFSIFAEPPKIQPVAPPANP